MDLKPMKDGEKLANATKTVVSTSASYQFSQSVLPDQFTSISQRSIVPIVNPELTSITSPVLLPEQNPDTRF
jgi:hypothetical protein